MHSYRYRFRPGLVPTLAVLLLFPLLVGLGIWQLDRAAQKRTIQAEYDARRNGPAIEIRAQVQTGEDLRFHRVMARGRYEPTYQVLVDNRIHRGRVGYHVITPLHIAGSNVRVLINRGWVPLGVSRAQLPRLDTPSGRVEVEGVATVPSERVFTLGQAPPLSAGWQPVWEYMDMKRYAAAVPFPVQPVVVLLDPSSPAGGFVREWGRLDAGIAVHEAYAFQWFTLAAGLLILYVSLNLRRVRTRSRSAAHTDVSRD
jgi:surfeit locus 1 family protein